MIEDINIFSYNLIYTKKYGVFSVFIVYLKQIYYFAIIIKLFCRYTGGIKFMSQLNTFKKQRETEYENKTTELIKTLPPFINDFKISRTNANSLTIYSYIQQISVFFRYLHNDLLQPFIPTDKEGYEQENIFLKYDNIRDYKLEDISTLRKKDIELFLYDLSKKGLFMIDKKNPKTASISTVNHYLTVINTLFSYLVTEELVKKNPCEGIVRTKNQKKDLVKLSDETETNAFIKAVAYGNGLSERQLKFNEINFQRDYAIIITLLENGFRVSELIGLNVDDIKTTKIKNNDGSISNISFVKLLRKRGTEDTIYFSDHSIEAINSYLEIREFQYRPLDGEDALFLSNRGTRITIRAVEKMVEKYRDAAALLRSGKITPHKLRTTFACNALKSVDIEMVAEMLGHKGLATVKAYAEYDKSAKIINHNVGTITEAP